MSTNTRRRSRKFKFRKENRRISIHANEYSHLLWSLINKGMSLADAKARINNLLNYEIEPERKFIKKKIIRQTIDIEPLWEELVPILVNLEDKEYAIMELKKIAVIADMVRQAQKKKDKIIFDFTEEI
jgi:hypothetical protein